MAHPDRQINKTLAGLKLRRSPYLMMYFLHGRLICENYVTRQSFLASPSTCELLSNFDKWTTLNEAQDALPEYSRKSVSDSVQNLLKYGLLILEDSDQDKLEGKFAREWLWPIPARYYHFSTKIDQPYGSSSQSWKYYEKYLRGRKQPPKYKSYLAVPRVKLSIPSPPEAPLFSTLRQRVTTREFTSLPISIEQLSSLLFYTWGRLSTYKTTEFGRLLHKSSPSAGARHPIEAYVVVNDVKGLDSGIYHYSVREHALALLTKGDMREKSVSFSAGQRWTRNAAVLIIMTAVIARTAWKYRIPRVYRAFLLDAGHLSQSFLLVATALRLGAFSIGIISDSTIEKELGLDGVTEAALFVVGVGHPKWNSAGSKTGCTQDTIHANNRRSRPSGYGLGGRPT